MTSVLYRVKKYQYVFYKHFLLHGLNVSVAVTGGGGGGGVGTGLVETRHFSLYRLAINTAYVMEAGLAHFSPRYFQSQNTVQLMTASVTCVTTLTPPGSGVPVCDQYVTSM